MKRELWIVGLLAGVALSALSCDRTHMGPHYGVAVRSAMRAQVANPNAGLRKDGGIEGLDPQEAAAVAETYRRALAPKGSEDVARRAPVLVIPAPGAQQNQQ